MSEEKKTGKVKKSKQDVINMYMKFLTEYKQILEVEQDIEKDGRVPNVKIDKSLKDKYELIKRTIKEMDTMDPEFAQKKAKLIHFMNSVTRIVEKAKKEQKENGQQHKADEEPEKAEGENADIKIAYQGTGKKLAETHTAKSKVEQEKIDRGDIPKGNINVLSGISQANNGYGKAIIEEYKKELGAMLDTSYNITEAILMGDNIKAISLVFDSILEGLQMDNLILGTAIPPIVSFVDANSSRESKISTLYKKIEELKHIRALGEKNKDEDSRVEQEGQDDELMQTRGENTIYKDQKEEELAQQQAKDEAQKAQSLADSIEARKISENLQDSGVKENEADKIATGIVYDDGQVNEKISEARNGGLASKIHSSDDMLTSIVKDFLTPTEGKDNLKNEKDNDKDKDRNEEDFSL